MAEPAETQNFHGAEPAGGSRAKSVVVELRDMIMRGQFAAGFHLQEVPLAERMGVSRTPIREALNLLAKEGLLEPGPKRGYKIRTFTIEEIVEAYELRATLEGMACRLLAEVGLSRDVATKLQISLEFGDRLIGRGMFTSAEHDPWLEMNNTIHSLLVTASHNAMLVQCVEQTQRVPLASARHVHWYRFDNENYELARSAHRDHHGIVDAILRRQAGRAEARMREHIHFSQELVRKHFQNQTVGFDTVIPLGAGGETVTTPVSDYETFGLGDFSLQKGGTIPRALVAYKTYGALSPSRDNAILFPTWFSSTHRNNDWLIGPGRPLDTARHFIIVPNLFGNGLSSSPSNTAQPFDRMRFPLVTVLDNVLAQERLITERFGIERLQLVLGRSMGAQAAFQWGSWFPDRVARLLPFCGSARTTPHNAVFLESVRATLTADSVWAEGEYTMPPEKGIVAVGRLYASWAMSQGFYRDGLHLQEGDRTIGEYLEKRWDRNFFRSDANDLLAMLATWQSADISDNGRFECDWPQALRSIACPAIVMPSRTDMYFPPEDSAAAVKHMPRAELRVIDSLWGHRAGSPNSDPRDIAFIDSAIRDLLATKV